MSTDMDETKLAVEGIPQALRLLRPDLGPDLDTAMAAGQDTAMTDLVLAIAGLFPVTRRSIIVTGPIRMCSSRKSLLRVLIVKVAMTRMIDHQELRG